MPQRLFGVDFSGARDAGDKIWLAEARRERGDLRVTACFPARELPGSGRSPEACFPALRRFIAGASDAAFGFDFPFALAEASVAGEPWEAFVARFGDRFADAEAFRAHYREVSGGKEIKRETDRLARVPFNGFNLRVYRQTYHGLRDVLAPLVASGSACVLPMQACAPGRPWLFEVCPASTLKRLGLYYAEGKPRPYKGTAAGCRAERAQLLAALEAAYALTLEPTTRERVLGNAGGDALDAVICAAATAEAAECPDSMRPACAERAAIEGYIYF